MFYFQSQVPSIVATTGVSTQAASFAEVCMIIVCSGRVWVDVCIIIKCVLRL